MGQLAVAPDSLGAIISHLRAQLELLRGEPVTVAAKVPSPRPERHVRVTRVGGPASGRVVDQPLILVEAWAQTDEDASALLNDARAILLRTGRHVPGLFVRRANEVGGPSMDPDPDTDAARWRCTIDFAVRMTTREV